MCKMYSSTSEEQGSVEGFPDAGVEDGEGDQCAWSPVAPYRS